jgi:hypothetical protein
VHAEAAINVWQLLRRELFALNAPCSFKQYTGRAAAVLMCAENVSKSSNFSILRQMRHAAASPQLA